MDEKLPDRLKSGKINTSKGSWVSEPENYLQYKKLIHGERDGSDLSLTFIEIHGKHRELFTEASSRLYFIQAGDFEFEINSEPKFLASSGEVIYIKRGDRYHFSGNGSYFVLNGPAFKDGDDIY